MHYSACVIFSISRYYFALQCPTAPPPITISIMYMQRHRANFTSLSAEGLASTSEKIVANESIANQKRRGVNIASQVAC